MRELFAKPFIRQRYEDQSRDILTTNEYYANHFSCSQGAGDGNLFRFFVENNLELLRKGGTLNYVIPTALWTDEGSQELRRHIFANFRLRYFYGFENRKLLFPDIDVRYKFGLMQIERPQQQEQEEEGAFATRFMLVSPAELEDRDANISYSLQDVRTISPRWLALMEFRSEAELAIMRKIHSQGYGLLSPDWIDFRNELHATADKKIFHEKYAEGMIPLYRGACIWQYDSEYWQHAGEGNRNEYWLDPAEMDRHLQSKERSRLVDDIASAIECGRKSQKKAVLDRLGLKKEDELDRFLAPDRKYPRLAFRAIASDTNERSVVAAIMPPGIGAQNSLWTSIPKRYVADGQGIKTEDFSLLRLFLCQAFFNSIVFDWVLRCSIAINVNKTYIWRMPLPQPTDAEIRANPDFLRLARNSLRLSSFFNEKAFLGYFRESGLKNSDKITETKIADMTRRENDLIMARLYKLNRAEMTVILDIFAVLKNNHPGYVAALLENVPEEYPPE